MRQMYEEGTLTPAQAQFFAPSRPEAFLGNLAAVQANRAYLIRCTSAVPVVWTVTGRSLMNARVGLSG